MPSWLDGPKSEVGPRKPVVGEALALPNYPRGSVMSVADSASGCRASSTDPEDYLARHRWGELTDSLLAGKGDWQAGLAGCVRWLKHHHDKSDPAWEPYSACERVANLLVFLAVMRTSSPACRIPPELPVFLQESLRWILRHLEYYGPTRTNNHILNNARATVMAAVALDDARARAIGMQILRQCLPALIMEGGFLRERSAHYQVIILNWLLDAWRFLGLVEGSESESRIFLGDYIRRMVAATVMLCEGGTRLLSLIGDVSPDLTPSQSLARLQLLYPEFWPPTAQSAEAAALRDGWFRIASGRSVILGNFPVGTFPPRFPTHGHGDFTSFAWLYAGREVLADRGRYRYTADAISAFQRGASGHNLPLVNGFAPLCESLLPTGQWRPVPYAGASLEASASGAGILLAHNGFARATRVEHHRRWLGFDGEDLAVTDLFLGAGEVEVTFCWHFGDSWDSFDARELTARAGGTRLALSIEGIAEAPRVTAVGSGQNAWISRAYAERQSGLGIYLQSQVHLPAQVSTRFLLRPAQQAEAKTQT